jgi:hypothetical protein
MCVVEFMNTGTSVRTVMLFLQSNSTRHHHGKECTSRLRSSAATENNIVEFIRNRSTTLTNSTSGITDIKGSTDNKKGQGERNTGPQKPRSPFTSLTLKQSEKVKALGLFNPFFQTLLFWTQQGFGFLAHLVSCRNIRGRSLRRRIISKKERK